MNASPKFAFVLAVFAAWPAAAQSTASATANDEALKIQFAERVVMAQHVFKLSLTVRHEREKCAVGCDESGALELAIGLIGISKSQAGSKALVNLLSLQLDGAASSDLHCQVLSRGSAVLPTLETLPAKKAISYCNTGYAVAKRHELSNVPDVQLEQVCRTATEFEAVRRELVSAIAAKSSCR